MTDFAIKELNLDKGVVIKCQECQIPIKNNYYLVFYPGINQKNLCCSCVGYYEAMVRRRMDRIIDQQMDELWLCPDSPDHTEKDASDEELEEITKIFEISCGPAKEGLASLSATTYDDNYYFSIYVD